MEHRPQNTVVFNVIWKHVKIFSLYSGLFYTYASIKSILRGLFNITLIFLFEYFSW